ncbi:hypothetical protein ACQBAU_08050 [Propionibacteriaceae bacterium Y2011]
MSRRTVLAGAGSLTGAALLTNPFGGAAAHAADEVVTVLADEVSVPSEGEVAFTLPAVAPDHTAELRVLIRLHNETLGGYGWYSQWLLDDEPLDSASDRLHSNLLNKDATFTNWLGNTLEWNQGDGLWHTIFAPSFDTDPSEYLPDVPEPYRTVLDITGLTVDGNPHTFTVRNIYGLSQRLPVVVSIEHVSTPITGPGPEPTPTIRLTRRPTVTTEPGGQFTLDFGDARLGVGTTFVSPAGTNELIKERRAGAPASGGPEARWRPRGRRLSANQWRIAAGGASYGLERTVTVREDRVDVDDVITNVTDADVGIRLSNHVDFSDFPLFTCRIAGRRSQAANGVHSPANPTLFFPLEESSIGMVANDDLLRNQSLLTYDLENRRAGFADDVFCLAPRDTVTMSWSIHFNLASDDYFDFVNQVRRQWQSNITCAGPLYFENPSIVAGWTDAGAELNLNVREVEHFVFWQIQTPPLPELENRRVIGQGTGIFDPILAEEVEKMRTAVARIKRVKPSVKVGMYLHPYFISPEAEDNPEYRDSWVTGSDGERRGSTYDHPSRVDYEPVFPGDDNSYGEAYLSMTDWMINDVGLDWLYVDESTGPGMTADPVFVELGLDRALTYNTWDGHTAILAEDGTIERKVGILPLLADGVLGTVADNVEAATGGRIVYNQASATARRQQQSSFVETQYTYTNGYELHLNTPLAYGLGAPSMATLRMRLELGLVYARTSLGFRSAVVEKCYPLTPTALHAGWIEAEERIIITRDGSYGWPGTWSAQVLQFDDTGALLPDPEQLVARTGTAPVTVLPGGITIIERTDG